MTQADAQAIEYLDQPATATEFGRLVGVTQQAISKQVVAGVFENCRTLREWLLAYCDHLREQAAGRGGSLQETLAAARAEEATVKSAVLRLQYQEKLGTLVAVEDARQALERWATFANREMKACIERLVSEVQAAHSIDVSADLVNPLVESTANRVADYAQKLGESIAAGSGDIPA